MTYHGKFSGNPRTEWLEDQSGPDRNMELLEKFSFSDPDGRAWDAPKTSVVNGASIPRALWSLVGSPYTDDYRRASVVHDVACNTAGVKRKDADVMFFHACRAGGCGPVQARVLYAGVRIGAWAAKSLTARSLAKAAAPFVFAGQGSSDAIYLQNKLTEIAVDMESLPNEPTIAELDAIVKMHVKV